jgi:hypothetical protein
MKIRDIFIGSIIVFFFNNSYAQDSISVKEKPWYVPDYVKAQFAGNIGLVSVGAGYQLFDEILYSELLYGFVPKSASKADNIHLITIKNTFPIFRKKIGENLIITPIAGIATTLDIGTNSFTTLPSKYPDGYYFPTAFHFTFFAGALIHKDFKKPKIFKGVDFYLEFGTVETYLWYALATKEVNLIDVFSADIGVNFYF